MPASLRLTFVESPGGDDIGERTGQSILDGPNLELVARHWLEVMQNDVEVLYNDGHGLASARLCRLIVDVVVAVVDDASSATQ